MPVRYFTLVLARWLQFMALQGTIATLAWVAGASFAARWWPHPASALAVAQALVLVLLGSYCFLLTFFLLSACAFWLDRVPLDAVAKALEARQIEPLHVATIAGMARCAGSRGERS